MTAAGIFSRTSNGKFSPVSHFGTSTSHKRHGLCEGSAYVHSSVRLYLLVLTRLYTYIFSMSIVFCDSSQYINRNKSNCEGREAAVRCFEVCRTSELPGKGFNCCGAKMSLRWAASRFAKPRNFLRKGRFSCFSRVRKEPKVHQRFANLWTPGTIQSSVGRDFAYISGGMCRNRFCLQNGG